MSKKLEKGSLRGFFSLTLNIDNLLMVTSQMTTWVATNSSLHKINGKHTYAIAFDVVFILLCYENDSLSGHLDGLVFGI